MNVVVFILLNVTFLHNVDMCTEFFIEAKDKSVVVGRSMEFPLSIDSNIVFEPKNTRKESIMPPFCPKNKIFTWYNKYDVIYLDGMHSPAHVDGMNSAGLSVSSLKLNGYTIYHNVSTNDCTSVVSNIQLVGYILGTYRSTKEVQKALNKKLFPKVWSPLLKGLRLELYYSIVDATGNAFVMQYLKEGRKVHKNVLRVATNSPPYDFHMLNIKNYVHLSRFSKPSLKLGNITITGTDAGSGLLGVPGDFTSPSRFVRTAVMLHFANIQDTSEEAVNLAFHILNTADIPKGVFLANPLPDIGLYEYTQWIMVKDLKNLILYVRSYEDLSIRLIDMKALQPGKIVKMPVKQSFKHGMQNITEAMNRNTKTVA